jgi:SAM-dependent methyltransferase
MQALREALFAYHHRAMHVPRVRRIARALGDQIGRARSLLDVGCGDGTVARQVAERIGAEHVAGVDIKVRPGAAIESLPYDGIHLPFDDEAFEAVIVADVLHHAGDPGAVLRECLRVASRVVAVKDHFQFGWASEKILLIMDVVGNAAPAVEVRGTYLTPASWIDLVTSAGGRVTALEWPLQIHDYPWRVVTRDALQFAARVEKA